METRTEYSGCIPPKTIKSYQTGTTSGPATMTRTWTRTSAGSGREGPPKLSPNMLLQRPGSWMREPAQGWLDRSWPRSDFETSSLWTCPPGCWRKPVRRVCTRNSTGWSWATPLDYATGAFDAVVSVGVLTVGHAPASSLDELVRVTRPGGHIVYTLRPDVYRDSGFKEKQESLAAAGKWRLIEVSEGVSTPAQGGARSVSPGLGLPGYAELKHPGMG